MKSKDDKQRTQGVKFNYLSHNAIKKLFVHIVNIVKPNHPYKEDVYPITTDEVKYSYKKTSSSYYASCGPRNDSSKPVLFKADKSYFNDSEPERVLSIITHELTHITVGKHSKIQNGGHPPRFWRKLGFNAHLILDDWDNVRKVFGPISKEKFIGYIVSNEVTSFNIDKRYGSEMLRKHEMANWFKNTLSN